MKLLLDANLSPRLVEALAHADYEAVHVDGEGLLGASDTAIFDYARERGLVVVTADSDFPMLLALRQPLGAMRGRPWPPKPKTTTSKPS